VNNWTIEFWLKKEDIEILSMSIINDTKRFFKHDQFPKRKTIGSPNTETMTKIFQTFYKWTHVVLTSSKENDSKIYLDGKFI
jgi:hypothetical protein